MKRPASVLLLCSALLGLAATVQPASAALPAFDSQGQTLPTLAPMLKRTVPAVVNVFTRSRVAVRQNPLLSDPFFRRFFNIPDQPQERVTQSLGSGVVVDAQKGYILTNNHVVDGADTIAVNLSDGRTLKAKLVGTDPETDIAVIKVEADKLQAVPIADSDNLEVGDFVVAIGNPFGLGQTVTSGIVSALGRSGLGIEGFEDFIQTDASINPGNSGGALVNLRGELVGINTAILSKSGASVGIGFAIPINMAKEIMGQLIEHGSVQRGQLGAQAQDLTPELAEAFGLEQQNGAVITDVTPGSPADRAGLHAGDIVTHINGRPVRDSSDVRNSIGLLRVGQRVEIRVLREGRPVLIRATVEAPQMVSIDGGKLNPRLGDATLSNIVEGMTIYGKAKGVVVTEILPGGAAWRSGLRAGDIISQANRKAVTNLSELSAAIKNANALLLNVQRGNRALFILAK